MKFMQAHFYTKTTYISQLYALRHILQAFMPSTLECQYTIH